MQAKRGAERNPSRTDERPGESPYSIPSHLCRITMQIQRLRRQIDASSWPVIECPYRSWLEHLATIARKTIRLATTALKVKCARPTRAKTFAAISWTLCGGLPTVRLLDLDDPVEFIAVTNKITCRVDVIVITVVALRDDHYLCLFAQPTRRSSVQRIPRPHHDEIGTVSLPASSTYIGRLNSFGTCRKPVTALPNFTFIFHVNDCWTVCER